MADDSIGPARRFIEWLSIKVPLWPHRYLLPIVIAFILILYSHIGFLNGRIPYSYAELVLRTAGVVATILLVVTYLEQLDLTTQQENRERYEPVADDLVSNLILPAVEALTSNRDVFKRNVDPKLTDVVWITVGSFTDVFQPLTHGLGANEAHYRILEELNPDLYSRLLAHDDKLSSLFERGRSISQVLAEPVSEHLAQSEFDESIDPDILLTSLINGAAPPTEDEHFNVWMFCREGVQSIASEEYGDALEKTVDLRQEYENHAEELHASLLEFWLWLQANPDELEDVELNRGEPQSGQGES